MLASDAEQELIKATAYHEAGHAVIAYLLDIAFEYVTIAPDEEEDALGHVQYGFVAARLRAGQRSVSRELRNHLIANRAGAIAEARYTGQRNEIGAYADDIEFRQCLHEMYGEHIDRHARDLSREARRLVPLHWQAVTLVAEALIQHQQLSFDQVALLTHAATSIKNP